MKLRPIIAMPLLTSAAFACGLALNVTAGFVQYADPFVGTDNTPEVSNGNLYPAIARPWGMNAWTPQTGPAGQGWLYDWKARKILGFHQTHQPSPWIGDYGQFTVMPTVGKAVFSESDRASWFSHKTEQARPHFYSVYLADHDVTVELTPTERAALFRVTYPATDEPRFVVDALDMGSSIRVDAAARRIEGRSSKMNIRWNERHLDLKPLDCWFVLEFDRPIVETLVYDGKRLASGDSVDAAHVGAVVKFAPTVRGERMTVRVASSFIGPEQARRNLKELGNADFDGLVAQGRAAWDDALGRIAVTGGSETDLRKFYTCLYRSLLFPRQFHEYGADGKPIHRSPYGKGVLPGHYYCDTGFWDTFRGLFPLLAFVYPDRNAEMMEGLRHCLEESGWLPEWAAPFHRKCMIGQNSASVIADAHLAGCMDDATARTLYEGLVKASSSTGAVISVGRIGFDEYNALGYIPRDGATGGNQSASRTLEYAYDDWCIYRLGTALGRPKAETDVFLARSRNWRNLLHPTHRLMCGRARDGSWDPAFSPIRWAFDFTEGTPLHYTWSVFHDIPALVEAMGGAKAVERRLDDVFALPPHFDGSFWKGGCTHEIREMQIAGFGQYAHGNQPIQHMIYLYDHVGAPEKARKWTRAVMDRLYVDRPDGYCGDEDNGQTSAWFVWSAIGMYPVCPASGEFALGAPLFDRVALQFPNGRTLDIRQSHRTQDATLGGHVLNGTSRERPFVSRAELTAGGKLTFVPFPALPHLVQYTE